MGGQGSYPFSVCRGWQLLHPFWKDPNWAGIIVAVTSNWVGCLSVSACFGEHSIVFHYFITFFDFC